MSLQSGTPRFLLHLETMSGKEYTRGERWDNIFGYYQLEMDHLRDFGTLFIEYCDFEFDGFRERPGFMMPPDFITTYWMTLDDAQVKVAKDYQQWFLAFIGQPGIRQIWEDISENPWETKMKLKGRYVNIPYGDKMLHHENLENMFFGEWEMAYDIFEVEKKPMLLNMHKLDDSFSVIPKAYLKLVLEGKAQLHFCDYCAKPFVTYGGWNTRYCPRIQDKQGHTCKQLGVAKARSKKVTSDPVLLTYRKSYNRNANRLRRGQLTQEEFDRWQSRAKALYDSAKEWDGDSAALKDYFEWMELY